jgi:aerotolerance regulator-like protein/VWA domain-containing protein
MTWLNPLMAGIAAAIAIPALVILYFLKLRRRDVEISTTLLWKKAIQDMQANAPFQKLRRNILLFLQLLVLAGILLAVAQPQIKGDSPIGSKHVLLIDRSGSMSAMDAKSDSGETISRLQAAKEEAIKFVETLREPGIFDKGSGDQAMVISFDTSAKALQSFTSDKDLLKAAISAITPSDAPSSLDEAFKLVLAQAPKEIVVETQSDGTETKYERPPKPVGTIHLYSDGRLPDAAKVAPGREDVLVYHAVGSPESANIGITSLRASRAFDNPSKLSVFVSLQSTDRQPRPVDIELRVDDTVGAIKTVDMPAAQPGQATAAAPTSGSAPSTEAPAAPALIPSLNGTVFTLDRPEGGILTLHLSPKGEDTLASDNTAWLVVPPAKKLAFAVVTRGNLFIAAAIEELPHAKLDTMTPEVYEQQRAAGKIDHDVIILDGYLPTMPKDSPSQLPPGRFLVIGAVPQGPLGLIDHGEGDPAVFLDWSRDHPALRGITLDAVNIVKSRKVEIPKGSGAIPLAITDSGPAIAELTGGDSRAIVVPFDIAASDWPFNVSFVVFIAQAVGYLGDDTSGLGQLVQPGGILSDRLPPGASDVRVRLPDRTQAEMGAPAPDGRIVYGPIQSSGVYQVSWDGKPGPTDAVVSSRAVRPFAANLLDPAESDLATVPKLALASREVTAEQAAQTKVAKALWPWLILAAFAIILLEWFVYNRKVQL